jgi:hypothetical protein
MSEADAKRFRTLADECRDQAAKAVSQPDMVEWLRLAMEWIKLAQSAEGPRVGKNAWVRIHMCV